MEKAYYIAESGSIRDAAIKIQDQIELRKEKFKPVLKELAKEFGCDPSQYYFDSRSNITMALLFPDKKPDLSAWKKVDGLSKGYMPKRNSKWGKDLYKRIVMDSKNLDINDALPQGTLREWKFQGMRAFYSIAHLIPFRRYNEKDVIVVIVPYDEMKSDSPNDLPDGFMSNCKQIRASEYQSIIDKYNSKSLVEA